MATRASLLMKKLTILLVDHEIGPIVFILGKNIAKYKGMP